eukprot:4645266-Pyramimonas_sp.AAC.2
MIALRASLTFAREGLSKVRLRLALTPQGREDDRTSRLAGQVGTTFQGGGHLPMSPNRGGGGGG